MRKSESLRMAIEQRRAVVVPGCHDALSARVVETCGFEAVQVSGFGLAASLLAAPDVGLVQMKDVLDATWNIAQAVEIPVMADADTGGGNAVNAAWVTERLVAMGVAGMNIEDQVFPKRCGHLAGKDVVAADEMEGKVRACIAARDRLDPAFVVNARTDSYAVNGLDDAIERCRRYLDAGADLVFIDGIRTREEIARAVEALDGPLSVNLMDGVTGVKTELVPIPELAAMGVARVSVPVASTLVVHHALTAFFTALRAAPDGVLPDRRDLVSPFDAVTDFLGLARYRELEDDYLPSERLAGKYA
jgi:2-methylisocitrate lyase-like PEP mutase family enzyme